MFHTKLADIIKSARFGKAFSGGYEVSFYHSIPGGDVAAWREDKKDDPFPTASGGYSKVGWIDFADTVDVYIDEDNGAAAPIKALDGNEYVFAFYNKDDKPLTQGDI